MTTAPATEPGVPAVAANMSQQERMFEVLDQDRDGFVTKLEAKDRVDDYKDADSNSDGRLDRAEFAAIELEDIDDNPDNDEMSRP